MSKELRLILLNDILSDISLDDEILARSLTRLQIASPESNQVDKEATPSKLVQDSVGTRLLQEIESRLSSLSEYLTDNVSAKDTDLPDRISQELESIASLESEISSSWSSTSELMTRISQLHTRLQADLSNAISTIPQRINEKHKASDALSAATIEAALVKLSLLRAQSHQKVYAFSSDGASMADALSIAYDKLKEEANDLMEEEQALEEQIEEYDRLMQLVDGGSGFAQVVEDYIRVEKETEECRRDLRRLGWTGD